LALNFNYRSLLALVGHEPVILEQFLRRISRICVHVEHLFEQAETFVGQIGTEDLEGTALDAPV